MGWQEQLISVYLAVCKEYQQKLSQYITRISNHTSLIFTDEEVITLYLFGIISGYKKVKEIHTYAERHLKEWFPSMPSYEGFCFRLNKISHLFEELVDSLLEVLCMNTNQSVPALIDSMPIIMAHRGRRFKACVAQEIATANGYCSTKKLHYYGVKLHVIGQRNLGSLPIPMYLGITEAGTGDIKVLDEIEKYLSKGLKVFGDKAYQRGNEPVSQHEQITLYTPVKKEKGQDTLDSADRLLSSAVSSVRQPIESLFNWIEEKTNIQIASKVRSFAGLMVHVFGKIAAALLMLSDKFSS